MDAVLWYDVDGTEIYEYRILRAIWSNNTDISLLKGLDPRQYCAVVGKDGKAHAISVYDNAREDLIRLYEGLKSNDDIRIKIKPIVEMENYECALDYKGNELYYQLDRVGLKKLLNEILEEENKPKSLSLTIKSMFNKRK